MFTLSLRPRKSSRPHNLLVHSDQWFRSPFDREIAQYCHIKDPSLRRLCLLTLTSSRSCSATPVYPFIQMVDAAKQFCHYSSVTFTQMTRHNRGAMGLHQLGFSPTRSHFPPHFNDLSFLQRGIGAQRSCHDWGGNGIGKLYGPAATHWDWAREKRWSSRGGGKVTERMGVPGSLLRLPITYILTHISMCTW